MARNFLEIENIPTHLTSKVKQNLKFKTGKFIWQVKFNTPLDPKTVKDTMFVSDSLNNKLKTNIKYDTAKELIEIEPLEPYAANEYYYLNITTKVKSRGGHALKEPVQIKFKL